MRGCEGYYEYARLIRFVENSLFRNVCLLRSPLKMLLFLIHSMNTLNKKTGRNLEIDDVYLFKFNLIVNGHDAVGDAVIVHLVVFSCYLMLL